MRHFQLGFTFFVSLLVLLITLPVAQAQDSLNVRHVGSLYDFWDDASDFAVEGNYVYIATDVTGLRILDISDPSSPHEVASFRPQFPITKVQVHDTLAFVSNGNHQVHIVSISSPLAPRYLSHFDAVSSILSFFINDTLLFLACDTNGVRIVSITNPEAPVEVGFFDTAGNTAAICVEGQTTYVADGSNGVRILNTSNPMAPIEVGSFVNGQNYTRIDVKDSIVYAYGTYRLNVLNVRSPSLPVLIQRITVGVNYLKIFFNQSYVYVNTISLNVYQRLPSDSLASLGTMSNFMCHGEIEMRNNHLYDCSISFLNISSFASPTTVETVCNYPLPQNTVLGVTMHDSLAFVSCSEYGLRFVDLVDPEHPQEISHIDAHGSVEDVKVDGNTAFVAEYNFGLSVVDITNPYSPIVLDTLQNNAYCIEIHGDYLFATNGNYLKIFDISRSDSIFETASITRISEYANVYDMAFSNNYLYLTDGWLNTVYCLNVIDPYSPFVDGTFSLTQYGPLGIDADNNYLYISNTRGYEVFNASNPDSIVSVSLLQLNGTSYGLKLADHQLAVSLFNAGIGVVNVWDPSNPYLTGFYRRIDSKMVNLSWMGNHVVCANTYSLDVYDVSDALGVREVIASKPPTEYQLHQNFPNPFNATTTIEYALPNAGRVELKLFDLMGREVSTLVDRMQTPGTYQVKVNSEQLSSGTYFYRLSVGSFVATRKFVVLR
ncbi:MAG: T9SS type A sorting domain-containing protein [bacterium]|nr:T9SS type A sorting domain-containing protein [bacterium]